MNDTDTTIKTGDKAQPDAVTRYYPQPTHILMTGGALGLLSTYVIVDGPGGGGPGFTLWLALLAGASLWLARSAGKVRMQTLALWSATAVSAAVIMLFRDLELLVPALWLVILASAALTALQTNGITLRGARIIDHLLAGFTLPLNVLTRAPGLLTHIDFQAHTRNPRLGGILRGIVIAVPVLLIFFALFASADALFSSYAQALTDIFSPELLPNLFKALVFSWIAASLLALATRKPQSATPALYKPLKLGTLEATVLLALVTALFALFVLLQLGYLFGGSTLIESTSGLTVAEYARRGFFELLVVGALTLALLLAIDATDCDRRVLRRYGTTLVVFVLIILASATQRLLLYTDAFGMTVERFSALGFMLWLAFNLVSFALTVLRGRVEGFASGLAISAVAALLMLGLVNPAAVVTHINVDRTIDRQLPLDVDYLVGLGTDVVPSMLERFDELPTPQQCAVISALGNRYSLDGPAPQLSGVPLNDWRHWNASHGKALRAIAEHRAQLRPC